MSEQLIWVDRWPARVRAPAGIITNPSQAQLEELGYRLKTPEMLQADIEAAQEQERQRQEAEQERQQEVEYLRDVYRQTMHGLCAIAEQPPVDKVESALEIAAMEAGVEGMEGKLEFTQLALQLQTIITELRRRDGDDAWERI